MNKESISKNKYHHKYGILSNTWYILKKMFHHEPFFCFLIPLGMFSTTVMKYLWTFISKFVIDLVTGEQTNQSLYYLIALFVAIQLLVTMLDTYFTNEIFWRYIHTRFEMMYDKNMKVMSMNYQYLEDSDVMDCYQKADNACNTNREGIEGMMHVIVNFSVNLTVSLAGILIFSTLNPVIVLVMAILAAINFMIQNYANKKAKETVWDSLATWSRKHAYMQRTTTDFDSAKEIRMYALRRWLLKKYQQINETRYKAQKENEKITFSSTLSYHILWAAAQIFLYAWLIQSIILKRLTIGEFTLYLTSATTLFESLKRVLAEINNLFARSLEVDDFRSFFSIQDGKADQGEQVPDMKEYSFIFHDVSFKYPKSEKYALKRLNLTIEAGERLAVVGLNGAGKSTMIKLLLRLYEPTEGEILLNGVNIKKYNKQSYYRLFAPVFQDFSVFAFPMNENVSMKSPEKTNKECAENALINAGLGEKIRELPKGSDTELLKIIYEDGIDLSGGEKQKLALARALYKNAPVVVLDEPTAALDALAESQLYQDFDKLIGKKTAVYISHRLSSTQFCNKVAMFQDGELKEYGTHKSLLELNGIYANLFHIQAQYYIENAKKEAAFHD